MTLAVLILSAPFSLAESVKIGGTGASLATFERLASAFKRAHPGSEISILPSMGSNGGIRAVAEGVIDIALSARPLAASENRAGLRIVPYATTPFVIATRKDTPAAELSSARLVEIYRRHITSWPDGNPIRIVLRPSDDSAIEAMRKLDREMPDALAKIAKKRGYKLAGSDQENADALERLPGSLGGLTLAQLVSENRPLKPLGLDGVQPSLKAMQEGRYPHFMTFYVVTRRLPSPTARQFVDFLRSAAGAEILRKSGQLSVDR